MRGPLLAGLATALAAAAAGEAARVRRGGGAGAPQATVAPELYRPLGDMSVAPILTGMWQVSGSHGYTADSKAAVSEMKLYADAGLNCFDLADHYGPAEDFVGAYVRSSTGAAASPPPPFFLTKWVPPVGAMTEAKVRSAVSVSLQRMNVAQLDMLQFHWWDYGHAGYKDALRLLATMKQRGGDELLVRNLALTNFNTAHLRELVDEAGLPITANQVQFSLLD
eukprot:COSAG05_NODE_5971_length_1048_cov_2.070601_1_plen_222_part_01